MIGCAANVCWKVMPRISGLDNFPPSTHEHNREPFPILNNPIRNPLQAIAGYLSLDGVRFKPQIMEQPGLIDNLVARLDRGWVESEKIRRFLLHHYLNNPDKVPDTQIGKMARESPMTATIPVVDDYPAIREIFTVFLEMRGFRTFTAPGEIECLELKKIKPPALILRDLMMEPRDGWETLLAIRTFPVSRGIPEIITTGKQPVPDEILQYSGRIEDFILKPVEFRTLVITLPRIIEMNRELGHLTTKKKEEGTDPAIIAEFTYLLRLVRITHNLMKRFGELSWADQIFLPKKEGRLKWLLSRLEIPDLFLNGERGYETLGNRELLPGRQGPLSGCS
jgi:CheY-like chemotaxis protein